MLQRIAQYLGLKQSATARAIVSWLTPGQPIYTPCNFAALTHEGYQKNVIVYRCVEYVANACAGIEWDLYLQTRKQQRERERHPLLSLFERPNDLQSGSDLIRSLVSYRLLSGNAYLESVHPDQGNDKEAEDPKKSIGKPPKELHSPRPDRMFILPGDRLNPIGAYEYVKGIERVKFPRQKICGRFNYRILHWKTFNPLHDFYGMSPLEAASRSMDQNNESRAWNLSELQNGARPSLILTSKEQLADPQYNRYKESIEAGWAGVLNAGKPLLLEGLEVQDISRTPVEMAWVEGLRMSTRELCSAFGVAPELIGDSANKTYSNYAEARKSFYEETVLPLMDSLRDCLNYWLTPQFGNDRLRLEYNRDDIEALQEDRNKLWITLEKVTFLTDNEKREEIGYEPYTGEGSEEADKLRKPVQMAPIDAVSTFEQSDQNGEDMQAQQANAKKAAAFELLNKADWLHDKQRCELAGFEYVEPEKALPPAPPVTNVTIEPTNVNVAPAEVKIEPAQVNVTTPAVNVAAAPVTVNLTMQSGKKRHTIIRGEDGELLAVETEDAEPTTSD